MNNVVIKVENISKKYVINHQADNGNDNFREVVMATTKKIANHLNPLIKKQQKIKKTEDFWALDNVNFEINKGDRVGIIGHNGSGKSTLLKLLSRITEPTTGKIHINGRIASLLEVGTGFHLELTGRENIFLNGVILGMKRSEIKDKFNDIVAFAGVDKFLDTPVKRYSSGMLVKLAFSVAAHLAADILIIDEVLAVGDADFQKKCIGKMNDVSKDGRTILFVSHNMNAIEQLCNKAILLTNGSVAYASDNVQSVIHKYFSDVTVNCTWKREDNQFDNDYFSPLSLRIVDETGTVPAMPIANNKDYFIEIKADINTLDQALTIGYCIYCDNDQPIYWSYNTDAHQEDWPVLEQDENILRSKLPKRLLNEGSYHIELIGELHLVKWLFEPRKNNPMIQIEIQGGLSESPYMIQKRPTLLAPILTWKKINA